MPLDYLDEQLRRLKSAPIQPSAASVPSTPQVLRPPEPAPEPAPAPAPAPAPEPKAPLPDVIDFDPLELLPVEDLEKMVDEGKLNVPQYLYEREKRTGSAELSHATRRKMLQAYGRQAKQSTLSLATAGKTLKALPGAAVDMARGAGELVGTVVKGALTGDSTAGVETAAALDTGTQEFLDLLKSGHRKLKENPALAFGGVGALYWMADRLISGSNQGQKNIEEMTVSELQKRLNEDIEAARTLDKSRTGHGTLTEYLYDQDAAEEVGLDPEKVERMALLDPSNLVPGFGGVKIAGKAARVAGKVGEIAGKASAKAGGAVASGLVKGVGEVIKKPGTIAREAGESAIAKQGGRLFGLYEAGKAVVTGDLASLAIGGAAAAAPRVLSTLGSAIETAGDAIKKGAPAARAVGEALVAHGVNPFVTGAAGGLVASLPFAAMARDRDTASSVLASGMVFGGMLNVPRAGLATVTGKLAEAHQSAERFSVESPDYDNLVGDEAALNVAHTQGIAQLKQKNGASAGLINVLRQTFRNGIEVTRPDGTKQRVIAQIFQLPEGQTVGEEGQSASGKYEVVKTLEDGTQVVRIKLDSDGLAALHESGHVLQHLMKATGDYDTWIQQIKDTFSPEQVKDFGEFINSASTGLKQDVHDEIGAELLSNVLRGTPLQGVPPGLLHRAIGLAGAFLEWSKLYRPEITQGTSAGPGYDATAPLPGGSSPLGVGHSFSLTRAAEDFMRRNGLQGVPAPEGAPKVGQKRAASKLASAPARPQASVAKEPPVIPSATPAASPAAPAPAPAATTPPAPAPAAPAVPAATPTPPVASAPVVPASTPVPPATKAPNPRALDRLLEILNVVPGDEAGIAQARAAIEGDTTRTPEERQQMLDVFNALVPLLGQAVEIEYQTAEHGGKPVTRIQRRPQTEAARQALLEGNRPEDILEAYTKSTIPYRFEFRLGDKGPDQGKLVVQVLAASPDKIINNSIVLAQRAAKQKVAGLIPYELDENTGRFTDDGLRALLNDLAVYARNHAHGYAGDGSRAIVAPADYEGFVPTPDKTYRPTLLPAEAADFINMAMGTPPPKTTKAPSGSTANRRHSITGAPIQAPANVEAQRLAAANAKSAFTPRQPFVKDPAATFRDFPHSIKDFNNMRDAFVEAGVEVRDLVEEFTERLRLDKVDPATIKPANEAPIQNAPRPLYSQAGFMPKGTDLLDRQEADIRAGRRGKSADIPLEQEPNDRARMLRRARDQRLGELDKFYGTLEKSDPKPVDLLSQARYLEGQIDMLDSMLLRERAGMPEAFMPKIAQEVLESKDLGKLFSKTSLTQSAIDLGASLTTSDQLRQLQAYRDQASKAGQQAMADGDFDRAMQEISKAQFFREAIEAATDSGSMAGKVENAPLRDQKFQAKVAPEEVEKLIDAHKQNGGLTFSVAQGRLLADDPVFVVSIYPERTKTIKGNDITPEVVDEFIQANEDLLVNPDNSLGTWYDSDRNVTDIDVVVSTRNRELAEFLGRKFNQKAIWDNGAKDVIDTGGTGERVKMSVPEDERLQEAIDEMAAEKSRKLGMPVPGEPEKAMPRPEAGTVNNEEFLSWFEGSKVVDNEGNPLRVYHGTPSAFKPGTRIRTPAHFGTPEQANDKNHFWMFFDGSPQSPATYPAYLRITNPLRVEDLSGDWKDTIRKAKRKGHDGITYSNRFESPGDSWIAFYPEQVRPAFSDTADGKFMPRPSFASNKSWDAFWLSPKGEVISARDGHLEKAWEILGEDFRWKQPENVYDEMFNQGYRRIVRDSDSQIIVEGPANSTEQTLTREQRAALEDGVLELGGSSYRYDAPGTRGKTVEVGGGAFMPRKKSEEDGIIYRKGWIDPDGKYYPLGESPTHERWARKKLGLEDSKDASDEASEALYAAGWLRFTPYAGYGAMANSSKGRKANRKQRAALEAWASTADGLTQMAIDDGRNGPEVIWNGKDEDDSAFMAKPRKKKLKLAPAKGALHAKGWILPNGEWLPLGSTWHMRWLEENAQEMDKQFKTDFAKRNSFTEDDRLHALSKGFIRVNYDVNTGTLIYEANKRYWTKGVKDKVFELATDNIDSIDNVKAALFDDKGNVVASDYARLFNFDDDAEKLDNLPLITKGEQADVFKNAYAYMPKTIKLKGEEADFTEAEPAKVDKWYDRRSRSWVIRYLDANGDQVGEAQYAGTAKDASGIASSMEKELQKDYLRKDDGSPQVFYRGEYGKEHLATRRGTLSFSDSPAIASVYAEHPNDEGQKNIAPRVGKYHLRMKNPLRFHSDEDVVDLKFLAEALTKSKKVSRQEVLEAAESVDWRDRNGWLHSEKLPVSASIWTDTFRIADSQEFVDLAKKAGYDGLIYRGTFTPRIDNFDPDPKEKGSYDPDTFSAMEYRPFSDSQVELAWGKFMPKSPRSSVKYLEATELPTIKGTGAKDAVTLWDVANYLSQEAAKHGKLDKRDEPTRIALAEALADEASYALSTADNAIGWYDSKIKEAMQHLTALHPELGTDQDRAGLYKALMAINSNGQNVRDSFFRADDLYEAWKKTDKIDFQSTWGGKAAPSINVGLEKLTKLIELGGLSGMREFLESEHTVGELKKAGHLVTGETVDTKVRGAMILGPKIGSFFGNLNGDFTSVTMDRWFMRTFNRVAGVLTDVNRRVLPDQIDRVLLALKGRRVDLGFEIAKVREDLISIKRDLRTKKLDEDAIRQLPSIKYLEKRFSIFERGGFKDRSELNRSIKNLYENIFALHEAPESGTHRNWIREVMGEVQNLLKQEGVDISNADLQALLWYYEKGLYGKLYDQPWSAEATDYARAAKELLDARSKQSGPGREGLAEVRIVIDSGAEEGTRSADQSSDVQTIRITPAEVNNRLTEAKIESVAL